ncbi:pyrroline-5-carboxylate reductase, partial [Toxoplasma gondii TgCatPRC2]
LFRRSMQLLIVRKIWIA